MSRFLGAALLLLILATLAGAQTVPPAARVAAPAAAATPAAPVATVPNIGTPVVDSGLMPGDTVTVNVAGEPAITGSYTVREDGRIIFPVAGNQQVAGLTPTALADRLAAALRAFVVNPVVSVAAISGAPRTVSVVGDVTRPGAYECRQACNVNALMALCGGCTDGDLKGLTLVRRGELIPLLADGKAQPDNVTLEAGDVVTVPSRSSAMVSVAGAVKTPSSLPISACSSAGKALLLCGGSAPDGDPAGACVLRGADRLPVNLAFCASGDMSAPDVPLQPGDVVMVPQKKEANCYVLGEVKTPGPQMMTRPLRMTTALAQAGGVTVDADGSRAFVMRGDRKVPVNLTSLLQDGNGDLDVALIAGDVVIVPKNTALVYMMGQVVKPGPLPLSSAPTALAAWGLAGRGTPDADICNAMLLRGTESTPLNLEALDRGETKLDVNLQPGDRIMVPKYRCTMYVLGQVNKPGIISIAPGDTLLDVLAKAGGPTAVADARAIGLVRKTPANCTPCIECPPHQKRGAPPADKLQMALKCGLSINVLDLARAQTCDQAVLAQPGDLIYVPPMPPRGIDWLQVLLTLGTALLINN